MLLVIGGREAGAGQKKFFLAVAVGAGCGRACIIKAVYSCWCWCSWLVLVLMAGVLLAVLLVLVFMVGAGTPAGAPVWLLCWLVSV